MDNQQIPDKLEIDESSRFQLAEAARWSRFVAIAGMVLGVLLLLGGIFINSLISNAGQTVVPAEMMKGVLSAVYVLAGVVSLLVSFYLFRFGRQAKTALVFNRQDYLAHSFKNLKMVYKVIGLLILGYLTISVTGMIITLISGGVR